MPNIVLKLLSSHQIQENLDNIARLRIDIFREYPYLYDGHLDYEKNYLKKFLHTPDSLIVVIQDNERVVGAMTGLPLVYEDDTIKQPWIEEGINIENVYYFSELLMYPAYRGQRLGRELFDLAEKTIINLNQYGILSLATVIRSENHPKKPIGYKCLDEFWVQNGFQKNDKLICHISWKEIGEENESSKPLVFWVKTLQT